MPRWEVRTVHQLIRKGKSIAIVYLGSDLAKSVFALHGVDEGGKLALMRPSVARSKLEEVVAALPPCMIGMEACSGAHHWARLFQTRGHTVRLIAPKFVVPYRLSGKRGKNDAADAAAEDQPLELSFDVPSVTREQLSIGIEGNVIRIETLPEAKRQYKAAYELPQDIDVAKSEAKPGNGVLTLKLATVQPESKAVKLAIN